MPDDPFADIPYAPNPLRDHLERNQTGGRNLPPTANYAYPRSHASGLAQEQPQTWRDWTKHTGIGAEAAEAYQATPDEQRANENYALKTYGPNDSYTWAASAPRGGYKDSTTEKDPFADIPVAKGKAQGGDPFADIKSWRVPPANEGPRANIRGVPQGMPAPQQHMGPPQRPTGPIDPRIVALQQIARRQAMNQGVGSWLKQKTEAGYDWASKLPPDLISNAIDQTIGYGADKANDALTGLFRMAGSENPETQAHGAMDLILNGPLAMIGTGIHMPGEAARVAPAIEGLPKDPV